MARLGYATVGSNDLKAAKAFYDALFGSCGVTAVMEHESGGRVYGKDGRPFFAVLGPHNKERATPGNGAMIALNFDTRADVDAFDTTALALGGTDEGAPGPRGDGFYGGYFRDLDGNKLNVFCLG